MEQLTPAPPGAAAAGTLSRLGKICPGIIGRLGKNCASVSRPGKTVPTLSRLGNLSTGTYDQLAHQFLFVREEGLI